MAKRVRRGVDTWGTIRSMIGPELERFRARYPRSRRRALLEVLAAAAAAEDAAALVEAGAEYFALTSAVPPGCYAECPARVPRYFLAGQRVGGRKRGEAWSIHPYHYQVWR
jgi:hypothetical protein